MNKTSTLMAAALTALLAGMALAGGLAVGQPAPAFTVVSGDEKPLNSSQLKGKVVTLFCEARDQVEKSRPLKNELNRFLGQQPPRIKKLVQPVAVVDCFALLDDQRIRRYFELGCEVKGLGRGHVKRIKDEVQGRKAAR